MRTATANRYIDGIKRIVETTRNAINLTGMAAGAKTAKEREALERGVNSVPIKAIRDEKGNSVPLPLIGPEPDWEKLKKMLLESPEPPVAQLSTVLEELDRAPHILRRSLREAADNLPHAPGGHPFRFDKPQDRIAAAERIERYRIENVMSLAQAIARTRKDLRDQGESISEKTLRRYYSTYVLKSSRS